MKELDQAIKIVRNGGIIIYPTDTAFGIGCRLGDEKAIERLFKIRKRPIEKAMPVLFSSISQVKNYVEVPKKVEKMMIKYWPGALTLVLECKPEKVPSLVMGGGKTLGVRIPNHDTALDLIKGVSAPIIGTSANFAGEKTPFSLKGLDKSLIKLVDFVLEGKTRGVNKSSTVVDCTTIPWKIIRQGDVVPDL